MSSRSIEADSRDNSPERDASPGAKRTGKKRKVLSCYACRDRKMKCDRVYPICGRCQKTGRADQCTYDPRLLENSRWNHNPPSKQHHGVVIAPDDASKETAHSSSPLDLMRLQALAQERKIEELERKLAAKHAVTSNGSIHVSRSHAASKEDMMFRGKGFKTQFNGATSIMSVISQSSELQAFTREALTSHHSMLQVKNHFKEIREQRKLVAKQMDQRTLGIDAEVLAALPDRNAVDLQVALYFETWETSLRILHEPSFWKEYNDFWEQKSGDSSQAGFAVTLLLMLASIKCITPKNDTFEGDTTVDRQGATNMIDLCDAWISRQPRKRLTLPFFQIRILSLLAKRANCVKLKQDWVASGDLVRLALSSGMHRDPCLLSTGKISVFEMELKKRLWITIAELEMQSSLESGIQSSLVALYWDTPAPVNLPDDALFMEMQELPAERPVEHFTSVSYLVVSRHSMPLRIRLLQLLNEPSQRLDYRAVLDYDVQVRDALSSLPIWDDGRATIAMALLQLQLRQFLLLLHFPFAKMASENDGYMHSFTTCVDTAETIISTHNELRLKGILAVNHVRNDVLRVALTLSRVAYSNCTRTSIVRLQAASAPRVPLNQHAQTTDAPYQNPFAPDTEMALVSIPQQSFLARTLCTSAINIIELAGQMYEAKIMRLGTGYMEYWLLCAATGMLPPSSPCKAAATTTTTTPSPSTRANEEVQARCKKTLDRFQALAFRVLGNQKDPDNGFASSLRTTMTSTCPSSDARTPQSTGVGVVPSFEQGPSGLLENGSDPAMQGVGMSSGPDVMAKSLEGPFDTLQDMQVDVVGGWNFSDFWAFDLSGDF
ncbi:hypothetical protein ACEQ8H_000255 [Pleosporales sp. CAS-2024a]